MELYTQIEETRQWLEKNIEIKPKWGIILGSGLGGLVRLIENAQRIEYTDIPHFKTSSVKGLSKKRKLERKSKEGYEPLQ